MPGSRKAAHDWSARHRLLRVAALSAPESAAAAWRAWSAQSDRWIFDPASSWWLPLVWSNLADASIDSAQREALSREYRQTWLRNQHALAVVAPLLKAFHGEGIRTLLLKGAALALTAYSRVGLRPFGDVDVLVDPGRAAAARDVLERFRWVPTHQVAPTSLATRVSLGYTDRQGVDLDLHWYALADCCSPEVDRGFWQRAVPLNLDGVATHVLCASDQLLHVCVHGRRSSPLPSAHWMADAVTIVRRAGDSMDWDALVAEARARRVTCQLRRALSTLAADHGAVAPPRVMSALRAARPAWWERIEDRSKQRPQTIATVVAQFWCRHQRTRALDPGADRSASFVTELQAMAGCERPLQLASRGAFRILRPPSGKVRAFDAYGRCISIAVEGDVNLLQVCGLLDDRLPKFSRLRRPGAPDRAYRIIPMPWSRAPEPRFRVLVNGQALAATATLEEAADQVVNDLQAFFAIALRGRTLVHAGVVSLRGRVVVLPGDSGSGKSTLVNALVESGATYFSDEFAVLDDSGRVRPYPRPLKLRNPGGPGSNDHRILSHTRATPDDDAARPVDLVLFAVFRPDGEFDPQRLTRGAALLRLLQHCPGAQARPDDTFVALRALVDAAPSWAADRGDTETVVQALRGYWREGEAGSCDDGAAPPAFGEWARRRV